MRGDLQKIFVKTPKEKQVMMFCCFLEEKILKICRKFVQNV